MFIPEYYKNDNPKEIRDFLKANSFGILINTFNGKPWGTHIPLEISTNSEQKEVLQGHIAKMNPQSEHLKNGDEVLCIFNGPHSYISSSWYQKLDAPTWNYIAVHIYGKIRIQTEKELLIALNKLVDTYEKKSKKPIAIKDMSAKVMRQVNGIIGFDILIDDIQAVRKLSQNRKQDHTTIINALEQRNQAAKEIAIQMKKG